MATDGIRQSEARLICAGKIFELSSRPSDRLISVIVPVKNSAADLREQLPRVLSQLCDVRVQVVGIDSGSTDDTVDILRRSGATALSVPPDSFNYGLTRNLAANYAGGEVFVFLTSRALPADRHWLANLIAPLDRDPKIAGAFSRSLPRSDADLLTYRDYLYGFERSQGYVRAITNWDEYRSLSPSARNGFVTFTNVSNAIRRSVFLMFPFREASYAEDRLWAMEVLEAGYKIQYEPSSRVLHSHNYSSLHLLRRHFDHGRGIREIVGLRADASDVLPAIKSQVESDLRYLRDGLRLKGDQLDYWRIASIIRRAAQTVGEWLGANEDLFGDYMSAAEVVGQLADASVGEPPNRYLEHLRSAFEGVSTDPGDSFDRDDESALLRAIFERIRLEWQRLRASPPGDPDTLERREFDEALYQIALMAAGLLAANPDWRTRALASSMTLIGQIRSGALTDEMLLNRASVSGRPNVWDGDSSLGGVLDLYEAEIHALVSKNEAAIRELRELLAASRQRVRDLEKDAEICRLELGIAKRDLEVRELEATLGNHCASIPPRDHAKDRGPSNDVLPPAVEERDRRIQSLSAELESIQRSKLWPLVSLTGHFRQTLDQLRGK